VSTQCCSLPPPPHSSRGSSSDCALLTFSRAMQAWVALARSQRNSQLLSLRRETVAPVHRASPHIASRSLFNHILRRPRLTIAVSFTIHALTEFHELLIVGESNDSRRGFYNKRRRRGEPPDWIIECLQTSLTRNRGFVGLFKRKWIKKCWNCYGIHAQ